MGLRSPIHSNPIAELIIYSLEQMCEQVKKMIKKGW